MGPTSSVTLLSAPLRMRALTTWSALSSELRISYATNTLAQLEEKRDQEVSLAARAERAGRPVPEGTRQAIEEYQRRMAHVRQEIAGYEKDKQAVREQYAPIIERLEELAGS